MTPIRTLLLASLITAALPVSAQTSDKDELARLRATTQALIDALVSQGLLTRDKAEAILKQAQSSTAAAVSAPAVVPALGPGSPATAEAPKVLRIPYVPETVRAQMRDEIKADVLAQAKGERWGQADALPDWIGRIRVSGDLRMRAQSEFFSDGNVPAEIFRAQTSSPAWSPDITNTNVDRQRLTLRARLEVDAKLSEQVSSALRITSGGTTGPTSTSQTLGSNFNRYALGLERASIKWQPPQFSNGISAEFGRFGNPFYGTDLSWPDDLAFDGVAVKLHQVFAPRQAVYATVGAFPLEEFANSSHDKWLLGAQVVGEYEIVSGMVAKLGLAGYEFRNVAGTREANPPPSGPRAGTTGYGISQYPSSLRLRGNTLININDSTSTSAPTWGLASRFRPVNLTAGLDIDAWNSNRFSLSFDWIKNTGFDLADIQSRAGVAFSSQGDQPNALLAKTSAYQGRAQIGSTRVARKGDWQAFAAYRLVERDSWIDGFTDTTWHLGGTNYKGWQLGGSYGLDRNFWVNAKWTSTRNLDDGVRFLAVPSDPTSLSGNLSSAPLRIDVFQLELNARF